MSSNTRPFLSAVIARWIKTVALLFGIALALSGLAQAATPEAPAVGLSVQSFYAALSCRQGNISVGQKSSAVTAFGTQDSHATVKLVQVQHAPGGASAEVAVSSKFPIWVTPLAYFAPTWTRNDDLIFNQIGYFASTRVGELTNGGQVTLTQSSYRGFPIIVFGRSITPSQVSHYAMLASSNQPLIQFDPETTSVNLGPAALGNSAQFLWDGADLFGRLRFSSIDIFDKQAGDWRNLGMPRLPPGAQVLLFRPLSEKRSETVVFVPGHGQPDRILSWQEGTRDFHTLATGEIGRAMVSPAHDDVYGYLDLNGRLHPISDKKRSQEVDFWLKHFSNMSGVIDFGIFDEGRTALVKSEDGAHAPRFSILAETDLKEVQEIYADCTNVSRGVQRTIQDGKNFLLVPQTSGKNLVVYLHGGPVNFIGREGSWISDIFTLSGHPLVVVNYTGSIGNFMDTYEPRNFIDIFGADVAQGIRFAERTLKTKFPRPIVVSDSFGPLVGLAAIASGQVHPSLFIADAAVVKPSAIFHGQQTLPPENLLLYFRRVSEHLEQALEPQNLFSHARDVQFLFLHGAYDETAPCADVEHFVTQFNALHPEQPAQLWIDAYVRHETQDKRDYDFTLDVLRGSVAPANYIGHSCTADYHAPGTDPGRRPTPGAHGGPANNPSHY